MDGLSLRPRCLAYLRVLLRLLSPPPPQTRKGTFVETNTAFLFFPFLSPSRQCSSSSFLTSEMAESQRLLPKPSPISLTDPRLFQTTFPFISNTHVVLGRSICPITSDPSFLLLAFPPPPLLGITFIREVFLSGPLRPFLSLLPPWVGNSDPSSFLSGPK